MNFSTFPMIVLILLFVVGMVLICLGGDRLVDAAVAISRKIGIPQIVVGATIVSLGTTLPEILVSSISAFTGEANMAAGNAFGSIICNTALIAGIAQTIKPTENVNSKAVGWRCAFFFIAIAIMEVIGLTMGGSIGHIPGIALLIAFCFYAYLNIKRSTQEGEDEEESEIDPDSISMPKQIITLIICAALLFVGAFLLKESGVEIANQLHIPSTVIAVTFVALSTSLPELVTTIMSLIKGYGNVGLGNVIGANLLNMLLVMGIPSAIAGVNVSDKLFFKIDVPLAAAVMALLVLPIIIRKKGSRVQGVLLLAIYVAYCVMSFFIKSAAV